MRPHFGLFLYFGQTYLFIEKGDLAGTVDRQVFDLVDPVGLDSFTVGLFELVAPQMVVIDAGLDVGDQQEAGKGKARDDKPNNGLHLDKNESLKICICFSGVKK